MKKSFLVCFLLTKLFVASLSASHNSKIDICTGGYTFHAKYKVCTRHSALLVEADVGRHTALHKCRLGKMPAVAIFDTQLKFVYKDNILKAIASKRDAQSQKIQNMQIPKQIARHSHIKQFLKTLTEKYYEADTLKTRKDIFWATMHSKGPSSVRIEPLPGSKLETLYSLHMASPGERMVVNVITGIENNEGQKVLTASAVCTTEGEAMRSERGWTMLKSKITFIKTKNGLQVVSKENIDPSSKWYQAVKKVIRKSMSQYVKFKCIHENLAGELS